MRPADNFFLLVLCCAFSIDAQGRSAPSGTSLDTTTTNIGPAASSTRIAASALTNTNVASSEAGSAAISTSEAISTAVSSSSSSISLGSSSSSSTSASSISTALAATSNTPSTLASSTISTNTPGTVSYETTYVLQDTPSTTALTTSRTLIVIGNTSASSEATAALNAASQENSTGLSTQNKKIIIGVIAGIAGLVILSAFATLLYRILGKKTSEDDYVEQKDLSFTSSAHDSGHPLTYSSDEFSPSKVRPKVGEISQNF